jgi:CHASE2 domain-containing sensor protein
MRFVESALGLLIVAGWFSAFRSPMAPAAAIEAKLYDWGLRLCESQETSPRIALVAVDAASQARLGPWPWSRSRWADLIRAISIEKPAAIGLLLELSAPSDTRALAEIKDLSQAYARLKRGRRVIDRRGRLAELFSQAALKLDADQDLAQAIKESGHVLLAARVGDFEASSPPAVSSAFPWALARPASANGLPRAASLTLPLPLFSQAAAGIGVLSFPRDSDGVVRRQVPVFGFADQALPSFPLALAALSQGLLLDRLSVVSGRGVSGGGFEIPLSAKGSVLIDFYGPSRTFLPYPAWEVLSGKTPASALNNKIVLVGPSSPEAKPFYRTAVDRSMTELELAANALQNILDKNFILPAPRRERWEAGLWAFAALFAAGVLPFMGAVWAAAIAWLLACGVVVLGLYFMAHGFWMEVAGPASAIFASAFVVGFARVAWFAFLGRRGLKREMAPAAVPSPTPAMELPRVAPEAAPHHGTAALNGHAEKKPSGESIPYEKLRDVPGLILGRGQSAWVGRDSRTGAEALIISRRFASLDDAEAFLAEGPALVSLDHPNLLHVFDFGEAGKAGYLAAEMSTASLLASSLRAGPLWDVAGTLRAAAGIGEAVAAAFEAGVPCFAVHPASIFMGPGNSPKLLNYWGGGLPAAAGTGAADGEPKKEEIAYLSPEAVLGKPLDAASSVFSIGVLLYELLTGKHPFLRPQDGLGELVYRIANDSLVPLSELNPGSPPCAQEIVMRALSKSPSERYAGPAEMAASLRSCLAALGSLPQAAPAESTV